MFGAVLLVIMIAGVGRPCDEGGVVLARAGIMKGGSERFFINVDVAAGQEVAAVISHHPYGFLLMGFSHDCRSLVLLNNAKQEIVTGS